MGNEPGHWIKDRKGRKYWVGPRFWTAQYGSSIIEYMTDRPTTALGCLLPDGTHGTVVYALQEDDGLEPQWLRPRSDGAVQSGRLDMTGGNVRFIDAPPRGYVSSFYRSSGEPGRWVPTGRGAKKWHGPSIWVEMHGHAVIEIMHGRKNVVRGRLLQDGTRGTVIACQPIRELRDGEWVELGDPWRRPLPDGSWNDGIIQIAEGDVRFVDAPPRMARQLGIRFPNDKPELEADLMASQRIAELVKDIRFATDLYRAMCNTDWYRNGLHWATTWRVAGGIAADLRDLNENYLDFYCSGDESDVAYDVAAELAALGWIEGPYKYP